jgi:hypothetical protein
MMTFTISILCLIDARDYTFSNQSADNPVYGMTENRVSVGNPKPYLDEEPSNLS